MQDGHIRVIEVAGQKFEVDLRTAKRVDQFKVGDKVKVLKKKWGDSYVSYPGAIVGIDAFQKLPTIVIAHIENPLDGTGKVDFTYLNADTKDVEICPMCEDDIVPTRDTIIAYFNRAMDVKLKEVEEIKMKKEWFLRQYGTAFGIAAPDLASV